tara:strand:+ start:241 stop:585 length:345 start_codon:yes stop_codon:yes gene_type:complete
MKLTEVKLRELILESMQDEILKLLSLATKSPEYFNQFVSLLEVPMDDFGIEAIRHLAYRGEEDRKDNLDIAIDFKSPKDKRKFLIAIKSADIPSSDYEAQTLQTIYMYHPGHQE